MTDLQLLLLGVLPMHMGGLHPYEKVLTLVLAFGPFLLLGLVIVVRRRQDAAEEAREAGAGSAEQGPQAPRLG